ncbi:hypothetical protein GCM10011391_25300 [Pullulanibacillus camelliae]|uniref:Uncharacterized protein n=1 Tax=Pullulanibacillus camelliae TaxID=1707096 RepID=A0A8J2YIJ7_9BACL|nr:hypothetical protein GCM10011391_25300 [Pullulanibacillus camelliae]
MPKNSSLFSARSFYCFIAVKFSILVLKRFALTLNLVFLVSINQGENPNDSNEIFE